jgi:hypothetical protein
MKHLFIAALLSVISYAAQANNIGMAFNVETAFAPGNIASVTIQVYNDSKSPTTVSIEPDVGELDPRLISSSIALDSIFISGKSSVFIPVNIAVPAAKADYFVMLCAKGQPFAISAKDNVVVRACDTLIIQN